MPLSQGVKAILRRLKSVFQKAIFDSPQVLFFTQEKPQLYDKNESFDVVFPEMDELYEKIAAFPRLSKQRKLFHERYKVGDKSIIVLVNKKIVHIAWYGSRNEIRPDYELGKGCVLPLVNKSAVIYDCWTPEGFRGLGYYPKTLSILSTILLNKYEQVWIYCLSENLASRRGIEKAGFKLTNKIRGLRVFGKFLSCFRQ